MKWSTSPGVPALRLPELVAHALVPHTDVALQVPRGNLPVVGLNALNGPGVARVGVHGASRQSRVE